MIDDNKILCQRYLNILYQDARNHTAKNDLAETHGEILYPGVSKLLATLPLTEQDVFFDLGSGVGKIVIQVFLESVVKEAHGIEIVPALHQQSMQAAQRVQNELPAFYKQERKLTFMHGSFLEIPLTTATVVLANSTCFSPKLLAPLGEIINKTPNIHTVLTTRPIVSLQRLPFRKTVRVECSWDSALCYVYSGVRLA